MSRSIEPAAIPAPLRRVTTTRYVAPLREGGSLPGLVEADDDGLYVLKFTGAGQGPKALVAEIIAGELARALGLPVPEQVIADLDISLAAAEPDPEVQSLLARSAGPNLGIDFLPGALAFDAGAGPTLDPEFAAEVVWFDACTTNIDRTPRNPNLLVWHRRPWLIDHGAALYVQHTWREPASHARRSVGQVADHVLLPFASSIVAADARLGPRIDRPLLEAIVGMVPGPWLADPAFVDDAAARRAYVDYLTTRLLEPRAWVETAEAARVAARAAA
jgi:hypothetical protein